MRTDGDLLSIIDDGGPFGRRRYAELGYMHLPDISELNELLEVDPVIDQVAIAQGTAIRNAALGR